MSVQSWAEQPAPFPVHDTAGIAYPTPFLGGFDVPRPQLVDIDGDGDLDLFVQERSGEVMFFENVDGVFTWRTSQFKGLDVGEWFRFVDFFFFVRPDLLGESRNSYIRAWRNVGTRTEPRFIMAADSLRDADGVPIFADRQNILNVVDIDADGQLDLFIGRVEGHVNRWESVGLDADSLPRFRLVEERWEGIEIIGEVQGIGGFPTRHGANTMAFGDVDGDGDLDLLWGDFFEPGVLLIENQGDARVPNFRSVPRQFPVGQPLITTGYNAPALADLDGNGQVDLLLGVIGGAYQPSRSSINNLYLVRQRARGEWEEVTGRFIRTVDVGNESMPVLADLDGDGDLDLLIGSKLDPTNSRTSSIAWLENVGTPTAPAFRERGNLPIEGDFHYAPAVADLDGDGLQDLVLGTWRDVVQFWKNVGTEGAPRWTLADSMLVQITRGSNTAPALADIDGDGLIDLVIGEASGQLNVYRNVGTATLPEFELISDTFQDIDTGRRSTPAFADFDGDGKPDLLLGAEDGHLELWRNVTVGRDFRFERVSGFGLMADRYSAPAVGDLTGDGKLELLIGGMSGGLRYWK